MAGKSLGLIWNIAVEADSIFLPLSTQNHPRSDIYYCILLVTCVCSTTTKNSRNYIFKITWHVSVTLNGPHGYLFCYSQSWEEGTGTEAKIESKALFFFSYGCHCNWLSSNYLYRDIESRWLTGFVSFCCLEQHQVDLVAHWEMVIDFWCVQPRDQQGEVASLAWGVFRDPPQSYSWLE